MVLRDLLGTLREVDRATDETVVGVGEFFVWGIRGRTYHPLIADVLPEGALIVTRRKSKSRAEDADELATYRGAVPVPTGDYEEPPTIEMGGVPLLDSRGHHPVSDSRRFQHLLVEEQLELVDLQAARQLLAAVSRHKVCLSLPLLVAVDERFGDRGLATTLDDQRPSIAFLGVRTRAAEGDENAPPLSAGGPHVAETIRVLRPRVAGECQVEVGTFMCHIRSANECREVQMRARYDLDLCVDLAPQAAPLPVELQPGPFVSIELSWPMALQHAAPLSLFPQPSARGCSAVVYIRCGHTPEKSLLSRYLLDLGVLKSLEAAHLGPRGLQKAEREGGIVHDEAALLAAVDRFLAEEGHLATAAGLEDGGGALAPLDAEESAEERPDRDFVDRLWLRVLSRCATTELVQFGALQALSELGGAKGIAPFVRKDNRTEIAEVVRMAVKVSMLRRYGTMSGGHELEELVAALEERRQRLARNAVPCVLAMGVECLRRDFLHIVTRRGYITAQDLSFFTDATQPVGVQLDRLRCLRHIAELAVMCTRYRLCLDTMRQLAMRMVEYYQVPANARGLSVPVFAAQLANSGRLLSNFPVQPEPTCFIVQCGSSYLHFRRAQARDLILSEDEAQPRPVGTWVPSPQSRFEYRISIVDSWKLDK